MPIFREIPQRCSVAGAGPQAKPPTPSRGERSPVLLMKVRTLVSRPHDHGGIDKLLKS